MKTAGAEGHEGRSDGMNTTGRGKPGRPVASEAGDCRLLVRFPVEVRARLDRLAAALRAERPGVTVSQADAVRVAVLRGLSVLEAERSRP